MSEQVAERVEQGLPPMIALADRIGNAITHIDSTLNEVELITGKIVDRRTADRRHVRVWFGEHVIASYVDTPALAASYARAMARRYAGLRVTNDPVPEVAPRAEPLPPARIWDAVDPH